MQSPPGTVGGADTAAPPPHGQPHVRPAHSLVLLSVAHAVNHAFAVLLPLILLEIIDEFEVGVDDLAFLAAFGAAVSGLVQLSYAALTRVVTRRSILTVGGLLFGGGFAAQALASSFLTFSLANIVARIGTSPQHPVGNALLAEQYPERRRGFAISAHIAGGNVGTVVIAAIGTPLVALVGWRGVSVIFGAAAVLVTVALFAFVRESGADRLAARAGGSTREALAKVLGDRDLRWIMLTSVLGGGGRGLGVVNLFALIHLTRVIGVDEGTSGAMYAALIVFSVPMPLVFGWWSDRVGRKPTIVASYLGGALGFAVFILAGSSLIGLWLGIVLMGLFSFAESPQLQSLLADIAPPSIRDAAYALYFTLAFGVGSLWTALYGVVIDVLGEPVGIPAVFVLMGASFLLATLATLPIRERRRLSPGGATG